MKNELLAPNGKPSNLNATQYELVRDSAFKKWFGDWEKDPANSSKVIDKNGEPLVVYHTTDSDFYVFNKKKSKDGFFFSANKQRLGAYNKSKIISVFLNIKNPSPNEFEVKGFDGIMDYGNSKNKDVEALYEIIAFEPNQVKLADGTNIIFDSGSDDIRFAKGGKVKGDCYLVAGQIAMEINRKKIDYKGTPYLVHAEVKHSTLDGVRFGHAFIEDDVNVYDFSNNREIIIPKQLYYYFGDINPKDKKKYRKYTFKEATKKMVSTGNYGCWDIDVEFNNGGEIVKSYKRQIPDYLKMFLDL